MTKASLEKKKKTKKNMCTVVTNLQLPDIALGCWRRKMQLDWCAHQ